MLLGFGAGFGLTQTVTTTSCSDVSKSASVGLGGVDFTQTSKLEMVNTVTRFMKVMSN